MVHPKTRPSLLVLVRHGHSIMNQVKGHNAYVPDEESGKAVEGIPDHMMPLTERGVQQAIHTGEHLKKTYGDFDVVYDSNYLRTIQTRTHALQAYTQHELSRMKIRHNIFLRERSNGYTYGMTQQEADIHFPYLQKYWGQTGPFYATPPGGESQANVCQRLFLFIGELFRIRGGQKILVFAHGHSIRAMRYNLEGWTPQMFIDGIKEGPDNCGIVVYSFSTETGRLALMEYNKVYW